MKYGMGEKVRRYGMKIKAMLLAFAFILFPVLSDARCRTVGESASLGSDTAPSRFTRRNAWRRLARITITPYSCGPATVSESRSLSWRCRLPWSGPVWGPFRIPGPSASKPRSSECRRSRPYEHLRRVRNEARELGTQLFRRPKEVGCVIVTQNRDLRDCHRCPGSRRRVDVSQGGRWAVRHSQGY